MGRLEELKRSLLQAAQKDPEARRKLLFLVSRLRFLVSNPKLSDFKLETRNEKPQTCRFGVRCSEVIERNEAYGSFSAGCSREEG
jgi:hypothetical protein